MTSEIEQLVALAHEISARIPAPKGVDEFAFTLNCSPKSLLPFGFQGYINKTQFLCSSAATPEEALALLVKQIPQSDTPISLRAKAQALLEQAASLESVDSPDEETLRRFDERDARGGNAGTSV